MCLCYTMYINYVVYTYVYVYVCVLYSVYMDTIHCTKNVQCTLYGVHCTLYIVQYSTNITRCLMYGLQYLIMYDAYRMPYIVQ